MAYYQTQSLEWHRRSIEAQGRDIAHYERQLQTNTRRREQTQELQTQVQARIEQLTATSDKFTDLCRKVATARDGENVTQIELKAETFDLQIQDSPVVMSPAVRRRATRQLGQMDQHVRLKRSKLQELEAESDDLVFAEKMLRQGLANAQKTVDVLRESIVMFAPVEVPKTPRGVMVEEVKDQGTSPRGQDSS